MSVKARRTRIKNRRNYYRLLQVQPDAPVQVIKASYRALMQKLKYHPDLGGDEWNATLINEAYAVLSDSLKRAAYDREQTQQKSTVGPHARKKTRAKENSASAARQANDSSSGKAHARFYERGAAKLSRAARTPAFDTSARLLACAFCHTESSSRDCYQDLSECRVCGSPLTSMQLLMAKNGLHRARRIHHQAHITFWTEWPGDDSFQGRIVDLSPTGMRFLCAQPLPPGSVLKIQSQDLRAVARVMRCHWDAVNEAYSTGTNFITLKLQNSRGTFVSENI